MHYSFTLKPKKNTDSLPKVNLEASETLKALRDSGMWWQFVSLRPAIVHAMALKGELLKNILLPADDGPKALGKFEDAKPFDYARWKSGFNDLSE